MISAVLVLLMVLPVLYSGAAGFAALAADNAGENIALGKPVRSNSRTGVPGNVTDGDTKTYWQGDEFPKYVDIDLMDNYSLSKIEVSLPVGYWAYRIYGSRDGVSYDEIASYEYKQVKLATLIHNLDGCVYRIIRVNITHTSATGTMPRINEVCVYGTLSDEPVTSTREKMELPSYTRWLEETTGKTYGAEYEMSDTFTADDVYEAVYGIIDRNIGGTYRSWFEFSLGEDTGNDWYEISAVNGKTHIAGNNGSSLAVGLNRYLKDYCKVHISQQSSQTEMPEVMPEVEGTVRNESPYEVRYAYNYCTLSYTMQFYGYDRWQRELDYLALSGVNVVLDTTATEALWVLFLQQCGYTADEAKDFVCGYAFKAWWLMGNLENTAGTVADRWIEDTVKMARVNQRFMTLMGMQPCLQGFMGMIPTDFCEKANDTLKSKGYSPLAAAEGGSRHIQDQGDWSGFKQPPLLKITYDGFEYLAQLFYETQEYIYGKVTHYFAGDIAHEGGNIPAGITPQQMSSYIMSLMKNYDEDCVWIIQCWQGNPLPDVLDGLTPEERADHLLVLDLNSTISPNYENGYFKGYEWGGSGWAFCMLDNYGGRPGVHGDLYPIMQDIVYAHSKYRHMKGIGIVAEGTQMNPVVQELLWEMAWRTETFDLNEWLADYAERRYGGRSENSVEAWKYLLTTAYGYVGDHAFNTNPVIGYFPSLNIQPSWGSTIQVTYDAVKFERATDLILKDFDSFSGSDAYIYDCVDLIRQVLTNTEYYYYRDFVEAYNANSVEDMIMIKDRFLRSIELMDEISLYEKDSTIAEWIGRIDDWINDDRNGEYDDYDRFTMRMNAKSLITTWTSRYYSVYAHREYSGQLMDYNYDLWKKFFEAVIDGAPSRLSMGSYFATAWNYIISDKEYDRTVPSPLGDANGRGIKAIWNEIRAEYLTSNRFILKYKDRNVATRGIAYAETQISSNPAGNLNDRDTSTLWTAAGEELPVYFGVNLISKTYFDEIEIVSKDNKNRDTMQFEIQALIDGEYVTIAEAPSYDAETRSFKAHVVLDEPVQTKDVRVVIKSVTGGNRFIPSIAEFRLICNPAIRQAENRIGILENGVLSCVPEGTTVSQLKKSMTSDYGSLGVYDIFGETMSNTDTVEEGCSVQLRLRGTLLDKVTVADIGKAPEVRKGDFDGDGEITVADALAALRVSVKLVPEDSTAVAVGDTDGDGHVTVADALAILRAAAKLADLL